MYNKNKNNRKEIKKANNRGATGEEVIFIFEKVLEGWKVTRIFNTIIQTNPNSSVDKKLTEDIVTGNCKVYENELGKERYEYYKQLREKVYQYHKIQKN